MSGPVAITLPDGAVREYDAATTGAEVAADIAKSLAKKAIACRIDGQLSDLSRPIEKDAKLEIVTMSDEKDALELVRHDLAHIMARAVQELWPDVEGDHRPGDRGRLLLRFRPGRAVLGG